MIDDGEGIEAAVDNLGTLSGNTTGTDVSAIFDDDKVEDGDVAEDDDGSKHGDIAEDGDVAEDGARSKHGDIAEDGDVAEDGDASSSVDDEVRK